MVKNGTKLKVIVISRKRIFSFPGETAATVLENLLKLLTSFHWQLSPLSFTPPSHSASTCIQFHAYSIRFSSSCDKSLPSTVQEAHLFSFSPFPMRSKEVNPVWKSCCITFWSMDFQSQIALRQKTESRWTEVWNRFSREWF